jgi:hypothetical protein
MLSHTRGTQEAKQKKAMTGGTEMAGNGQRMEREEDSKIHCCQFVASVQHGDAGPPYRQVSLR